MAQAKPNPAPPDPEPGHDWSTPAKRVDWLLRTRFSGNRSKMGRAIGFSPSAVTKVVAGEKAPGGRLLNAIVQKLGVDARWLFNGQGEPFGFKAEGLADPSLWMPARDRLLTERLPWQLREPEGELIPVPTPRPSTQYWYRLGRGEPILAVVPGGFRRGDLLLLETDPARFPSQEGLLGDLCAMKGPADATPSVRLGFVEFVPGDEVDIPGHLEADTFDSRPGDLVEEFVFRRHRDGSIEGEQRRCRKIERRGRVEYVPVRKSTLVDPERRRIQYTDIVAVWTGILYRRGPGPFI